MRARQRTYNQGRPPAIVETTKQGAPQWIVRPDGRDQRGNMPDPISLDELRRSFWFLPAIGLTAGLVFGFGIVELDYALSIDPGVFNFIDVDSARAVLETIATVTVSVAGLSFSVTIVALQMASQQLSPSVLRTFQADRLSQTVLAVFVGTFLYALVVLVKLTDEGVPALSVTIAILGAVAAFGLFVAFIHHIVISLKASTVIKRIAADGRRAIPHRWPAGVGGAAPDGATARRQVERLRTAPAIEARAPGAGFVSSIDGSALIAVAEQHAVLVRQCVPIGAFVLTGTVLASLHGDVERPDDAAEAVAAAFSLDDERAVVGDVEYPVRQLADVALRCLSPSLNDATSARNAIDALADLIVRFAAAERPEPIRVGPHGEPRVDARLTSLADLVRVGFEEVRVSAAAQPVVACTIIERLAFVQAVASEHGGDVAEVREQARRMSEAVSGQVPNEEDGRAVQALYRRHFE